MGSHRVVGIDLLLAILGFLIINYFFIYLIVTKFLNKSEMRKEIDYLKIELEKIKEITEGKVKK